MAKKSKDFNSKDALKAIRAMESSAQVEQYLSDNEDRKTVHNAAQAKIDSFKSEPSEPSPKPAKKKDPEIDPEMGRALYFNSPHLYKALQKKLVSPEDPIYFNFHGAISAPKSVRVRKMESEFAILSEGKKHSGKRGDYLLTDASGRQQIVKEKLFQECKNVAGVK